MGLHGASERKTVIDNKGAFALTTSNMAMEDMVLTRAIAWLATHTFQQACFLSDSMSMLGKTETGWIQRQ
jgi:ribonuclease HI